jgi:RNA polymerase sigma factor (sigma-70 family)
MAVAIPRPSGARSRNEGALTAALYKQHAGELLRFAWHRLGRLEDAEDAVQATFLSAHRVLAEGERVREPRAWLFRILRNECLTRIAMTKRRGVHEELGEWHADGRSSVAEQMESRDEFDVAVALLATLPEQQREALVLREWLGMSAIETADVLDVTPQGVDALVYRARKSLVGLDDVAEESTCGEVRQALADAKINNRVRAHLLSCRSCRAAARRLHAPEEMAAANGMLPLDSIAARLGESIPGFAVAGGVVVAAGGTAAAVGIAGSIAAGTTAKVVATVAIGAVVATGVAREAPAIRNAVTPASNVQEVQSAPKAERPASADGTKRIVSPQSETAAAIPVKAGGAGSAAAAVVAAEALVVEGAAAPPAEAAGSLPVALPTAAADGEAPADVSGEAAESDGQGGAPVNGSKAPVVAAPATPTKAPVLSQPSSDRDKRQEEQAARRAEAAAEQAKRQEEQAAKRAEAAAAQEKRQEEQAAKRAEAAAAQEKRQEEQAAKRAEEQAKRQEEQAAKRAEAAAAQAKRQEEQAAKRAEEQAKRQEEQAAKRAEAAAEKAKRQEEQAAKRAEAAAEKAKRQEEQAAKPTAPVVVAPPVETPATEPAKAGKDRDQGKDRDK